LFSGLPSGFFDKLGNLKARIFHSTPSLISSLGPTSGIKNLAQHILHRPVILKEGDLEEITSWLEGEGEVNRASILRDAYATAIRRYSELKNLPIQIRITEGVPSIAGIEGHTLVLDHFLLDD